MATKKYKPTTPGQRTRSVSGFEEITGSSSVKSLLKPKKGHAGRNNTGRVTVRFRGGKRKNKYRVVDFKRGKDNIEGKVVSIEYDPNRTANIALIAYKDGEKRYIVAPSKLKVGQVIKSGNEAEIKVANTLPLKDIPNGSSVHNIEMAKGKGGQIARSAGAYAVIMGKHEKYVTLKMPSGEVRLIHNECKATIGQVGNSEHRNTVVGKAGASRWKGKRPHVRGAVMNPCDHPHGGGEGRAPVGQAGPRTPWGKPTLGYKTRNKRKKSNKYITSRRK